MKTFKYSTNERAERVAKSLGCVGSHYHNENGERKYMPCKSHDIFLNKKNKDEETEQEVTELVDTDGTWLSSKIPILSPANNGIGTKTTDQIVPAARNPRDPLLRGWYGYYGEGHVKEINMSKAYGYNKTKNMNAKKTLQYFKKELKMDPEEAEDRVDNEFGKNEKRDKRSKYKNKKGFVGRPILKEKEIDESDIAEDILFDKPSDYEYEKNKDGEVIHPLLVRNIRSLKKLAKEYGVSLQELIQMLKNEQ